MHQRRLRPGDYCTNAAIGGEPTLADGQECAAAVLCLTRTARTGPTLDGEGHGLRKLLLAELSELPKTDSGQAA